jgi:hypothetical protein
MKRSKVLILLLLVILSIGLVALIVEFSLVVIHRDGVLTTIDGFLKAAREQDVSMAQTYWIWLENRVDSLPHGSSSENNSDMKYAEMLEYLQRRALFDDYATITPQIIIVWNRGAYVKGACCYEVGFCVPFYAQLRRLDENWRLVDLYFEVGESKPIDKR